MTKTEKFRNWLDKEPIIELVFQTLEEYHYKSSFKNAKILWLDMLQELSENGYNTRYLNHKLESLKLEE